MLPNTSSGRSHSHGDTVIRPTVQVQGYFLDTLMRGWTNLSVYALLRQNSMSLYKHSSEVAFCETPLWALLPLLYAGKRYIYFSAFIMQNCNWLGFYQIATTLSLGFFFSFLSLAHFCLSSFLFICSLSHSTSPIILYVFPHALALAFLKPQLKVILSSHSWLQFLFFNTATVFHVSPLPLYSISCMQWPGYAFWKLISPSPYIFMCLSASI